MAKFSPLHDRILVRRVEEASTTRGESSSRQRKRQPQEGIVVSTGKAAPTMKARPSLSPFMRTTASCSASIPVPKSRSMAKTSSS